jgi:hypothetical protein
MTNNYELITKSGAVAQLVRAPALQAGGQGFESLQLHQIWTLEIRHWILEI